MLPTMLENVRIVLVRPTGPANVGAVARAMANMGLRDLAVVAPKHPLDHPDTVAYASHGGSILTAARVVATTPEALTGCVRSYATSSKLGLFRRQAAITPADAAREALPRAVEQPVAFAFGPESTGFHTDELLLFDRIVTIPADDSYPVLNLAAAVMVICYALRVEALAYADEPPLPLALEHGPAHDEQKQVLFDKLFDALGRIGFFSVYHPDKLKYALRHLFGRMDLNRHEADILIGMAQQIRWHADHHSSQEATDDDRSS